MIKVWGFSAESFERRGRFALGEDTPFIGTESQAEAEAERRSDEWEAQNNDFICRVFMESRNRKREV